MIDLEVPPDGRWGKDRTQLCPLGDSERLGPKLWREIDQIVNRNPLQIERCRFGSEQDAVQSGEGKRRTTEQGPS